MTLVKKKVECVKDLCHRRITRSMNQVFLSQLHRRARLLNTSFQQFVAAVVCQHSSTQSSALNDTGGDGSNQLKLTPAQQTLLSGFWDSKASAATAAAGPQVFTCLFTDGQRAQVHVQSAPVKTLARMREKLTKYVLPSPIPRLFFTSDFVFGKTSFHPSFESSSSTVQVKSRK